MKILLVEDDIGIAEPLAKGLEREGFEVIRAGDGREALEAPAADVVILDLRLPDIDGYEVCRRLRARSQVPIIMVSARGEEVDRVIGLELGADDYIVKPFGFRELVARIRAVTRRTGAPLEHRDVLRVVDLELDRRSRRASRAGRELPLTPREFDLLALLMEEAGAALPRTRIMEEVWDSHWFGTSKTLDVHVASLRKKLGDPRWIETVRAVGFRLGSSSPTFCSPVLSSWCWRSPWASRSPVTPSTTCSAGWDTTRPSSPPSLRTRSSSGRRVRSPAPPGTTPAASAGESSWSTAPAPRCSIRTTRRVPPRTSPTGRRSARPSQGHRRLVSATRRPSATTWPTHRLRLLRGARCTVPSASPTPRQRWPARSIGSG